METDAAKAENDTGYSTVALISTKLCQSQPIKICSLKIINKKLKNATNDRAPSSSFTPRSSCPTGEGTRSWRIRDGSVEKTKQLSHHFPRSVNLRVRMPQFCRVHDQLRSRKIKLDPSKDPVDTPHGDSASGLATTTKKLKEMPLRLSAWRLMQQKRRMNELPISMEARFIQNRI